MNIRPADFGDIPAITAIYRLEVERRTATFELEAPSEADMRGRMQGLRDSGFPYLVAEIDGAVAGYAYAGLYRTRPAYRFTLEDSVYVAAPMQGKGVGRALLERLITDSTTRGFRQMVAVIGDSTRQQASIRLHAAAGFAQIGRLPAVGFKFGEWLDSIYMQRALGDGDRTTP